MFSEEEKTLVQEALAYYLQVVSQQAPHMLDNLTEASKTVIEKIATAGQGQDGNNKPHGISDEWFESVCQKCEFLDATGCKDGVTKKYPGKCDPILKYEMAKSQQK